MGNSKSEEAKFREEFDKFFQNPRYISYDEHGNLVYGLVHSVPRAKQLRTILQLDHVDEVPGSEWCIMDSAWIASWLAYVHGDTKVAPAPGPCRNHRLLQWDYGEGKYKGRAGLFMAVKESAGDYRRVSREVWDQFLAYYPGSGPTITVKYDPAKAGSTEDWEVHDPPDPPEDAQTRKKKKKRFAMKMKRFSVLGKKKKDGGVEEEVEEGEEESKRERPDAADVVVPERIVIRGGVDSDDDDLSAPPVGVLATSRSAASQKTSDSAPGAAGESTRSSIKPFQAEQGQSTIAALNISIADQRAKDSDDDEDYVSSHGGSLARRPFSVDTAGSRSTSIDYAAANKERRATTGMRTVQAVNREEMLQNVYFKD